METNGRTDTTDRITFPANSVGKNNNNKNNKKTTAKTVCSKGCCYNVEWYSNKYLIIRSCKALLEVNVSVTTMGAPVRR